MKITDEVRECVRRLGKAFKREANRRAPEYSYGNIAGRISAALGIGRSTVAKIIKADTSEAAVQSVVAEMHKNHMLKNIKQRSDNRLKHDDFSMQIIKRTVHQLFSRREYVTLAKLKGILSEMDIVCSLSALRKYLHKLGFVYKKSHGKRFLKESMDVIAARHSYLRKIKQYREEGWEIVYVDETWVNSNHACTGEWTHNKAGNTGIILPACRQCSRHIPSGKGSRLIVLDAGSSSSGFIDGVGLIFNSKTTSADYHDEMNGRHFLECFEDVLIPALPNPSTVVLDNAPYHNIRTDESVYPTSNSKKAEIIQWLQDRNIDSDENMLKCELLNLVKINKPNIQYKTDVIAAANGHAVLRLPVRHCELNPNELIQAEEKMYVARKNKSFKLKDVKELFLEAKASITVEKWAKAVQHVIQKVEPAFWNYDGIMEEEVPPFIINVDEDDESDFDIESDDDTDNSDTVLGPAGDATNNADMMELDGDSDKDNDSDLLDQDMGSVDNNDDDNVLCKSCSRSYPTGRKKQINWLFCDLCESWYHVSCLNISQSCYKKIIENEIYWCSFCKNKLYN